MSNAGLTPQPLFNNNKSLYGARTQANQFSRKISIIEDKTTQELFRAIPPSSGLAASSNGHFQRSTSNGFAPLPSEPSSSRIHKQIEVQKQVLHSYELEQLHENIFRQLNEWKGSMYQRVQTMKETMSEENAQACHEVLKFQDLARKVLEESLIQKLLQMKDNPQTVDDDELDRIEEQLDKLKDEIETMKNFNLQLDCSSVDVTGELQLNKLTDFSKHLPLPYPPPSPPPPSASRLKHTSLSMDDQLFEATSVHSQSNPLEHKPSAPVWTDTTRQGLNSLSRYLPLRLLIPIDVREELIENFDIDQFPSMLKLSSSSSSVESILTVIDQSDLDQSFDILTDLLVAFKCSSALVELRLLFQKKFLPIITGKRHERLERFKSKYQLDVAQIFPQPCPQSDERVVLLRCQHSEYIVYCLREIIQNILEQAHFTDEDKQHVYAMYDPSVNYDESAVHDYGGYLSTNVCEISVHSDLTNSTEDATESKQPSAMSVRSSSSSSLSKIRHNSEENPLNYDDTDPESDDDDDSKRSKSSDDKRIFVKELNYVKGRQVGLLIGPFGQHITQIREQTGAKIHLTNDDNEPSVIKGTKSQINQALRLIKECLQTQKPIPRTAYKGGRRR